MTRLVHLTAEERQKLLHLRDHDLRPYLRERAAALLKIADGHTAAWVAQHGLLRARKPDTIYEWLNRFTTAGVAGLTMRPGRGRKPAFSPSACHPASGD